MELESMEIAAIMLESVKLEAMKHEVLNHVAMKLEVRNPVASDLPLVRFQLPLPRIEPLLGPQNLHLGMLAASW